MLQRLKQKQSGLAAIEVIVAIALVATVVSSVVLLVFSLQDVLISTVWNQETLYAATQEAEDSRIAAKDDFASIQTETAEVNTEIVHERDVNYLSSYFKVATEHIRSVEEDRYFSEIPRLLFDKENFNPSDTCDLELEGDWAAPEIFSQTDLSGMSGFATSTSLDVLNNYVYVGLDSAVQSQIDLAIIDISDTHNPHVVGSLNTGPGIADLVAFGQYVYAANMSINGQMQVIDVSNPAAPVLMQNLKLPGVTGAGVGRKIFYHNSKIYLGTEKTTGHEFHVIGVTNPLVPIWQGSYELATSVNDIFVSDTTAYLAVPQEPELRMLSIGNPAAIVLSGSYTMGNVTNHPGKSLYVLGQEVFFGRSLAGFDGAGQSELFWLNAEDPSAISSLAAVDSDYSVREILYRSNMVFVVGNGNAKHLEVYGLSSPAGFEALGNLELGSEAVALDCQGQELYILSENPATVVMVSTN